MDVPNLRCWLLIALLTLTGGGLVACAGAAGIAGARQVRPGVYVHRALAGDLLADRVQIEPAAGSIPMSVNAVVLWHGVNVQPIEYRIEFTPTSAGSWPWKPAVLRPGEETLLAESAYDTRATDWRMEIRPRR